MRSFTAVFILLLLSLSSLAQEKAAEPDTPEQAAEQVLTAFRARDNSAMEPLAARDKPDPWLVADELCARGEHDAAQAFAEAGTGPDVEALPRYLKQARSHPPEPEVRKSLAFAEAGEGYPEVEPKPGTILEIRVLTQRGKALVAGKQLAKAYAVLVAGGEKAGSLGWLARGADLWNKAGSYALELRDFRRAGSCWEQAVALGERRSDSVLLHGSRVNLGMALYYTRQFDRALKMLELGLEGCLRNGKKIWAANALTGIGNVLADTGRIPEAIERYKAALELQEEVGNHSMISRSLFNLGLIHRKHGRRTEALSFLEQALEASDEGGAEVMAIQSLGVMARIHLEGLEMRRSLEIRLQALERARKLGHPQVLVDATRNAGQNYLSMGEFTKARELLEQLPDLRKKTGYHFRSALDWYAIGFAQLIHGRRTLAIESLKKAAALAPAQRLPSTEIDSLLSLSKCFLDMGRIDESREAAARGLDRARAGNLRAEEGRAIGVMAKVVLNEGDIARGQALLKEGLALARTSGDIRNEARIRTDLAGVCIRYGDTHGSRENLTRALEIYLSAGDVANAHAVQQCLANRLAKDGDPEGALSLLEKSLVDLRKTEVPDWVATTQLSIGRIHISLGDYEAALTTLEEAGRISEGCGNHRLLSNVLRVIGYAHRLRGNSARSLEFMRRSVTHAELAADPGLLARALLQVAKGEMNANRPARSVELCRRAVGLIEAWGFGLEEEKAASIRENWNDLYVLGALAAGALNDPATSAYFLECGHAALLRRHLGGRQVLDQLTMPAGLLKEEARAREEEAKALAEYRAALAGGNRRELAERRRVLDQSRAKVADILERSRASAEKEGRIGHPVAADLSELQACLKDDEALVLFGQGFGIVIAVVITGDAVRGVNLGSEDNVGRAARLDLLAISGSDSGSLLALARKTLVDPLSIPEGIKRVLVSPQGILGYVPFACLMPHREVVYTPSGSVYRILVKRRDESGKGVLALGNPDYGLAAKSDAVALLRSGRELTPLPHSGEEARAVGDVVFLGPKASESALRKSLKGDRRWRAVHLACHGLVDPEHPRRSSLVLSADGENDGFLTTLDVIRLRVLADLVVLSACDTARGKVYDSEGIVGLTRAFMAAGAPRVICSLWKVDDEATKALMVKFYQLWNPKEGEGLPAATALKQAQEFVRSHDKWKHSSYWAAWMLWGMPD